MCVRVTPHDPTPPIHTHQKGSAEIRSVSAPHGKEARRCDDSSRSWDSPAYWCCVAC
jgi:hypothetical protein